MFLFASKESVPKCCAPLGSKRFLDRLGFEPKAVGLDGKCKDGSTELLF